MTATPSRSRLARAVPIVHDGVGYWLTPAGVLPAALRSSRRTVRRGWRDERGAITASGLFGLTLEKMLNNTAAIDLEAADMKYAMITDTETPDFDLDDFWADLSTNEVAGTGYTAGGQTIAGAAITVGSPAAGQLKWDINDPSWTTSTIPNAMAGVPYADAVASDPVIAVQDFVTAASSTAGTFTVQIATNGICYIDFTP